MVIDKLNCIWNGNPDWSRTTRIKILKHLHKQVIKYYLVGSMDHYPTDLPWINKSKTNGMNPRWLNLIKESNNDQYRRVMISIFAKCKILNDYPKIDLSSIEEPNS
jgi:hypothetical protein